MKYLCVLFLLPTTVFAYDSNYAAEVDAKQAILEATYKQSGAEKNITAYMERQIPDKYKPLISKVGSMASVIVNKKVEVKWSF